MSDPMECAICKEPESGAVDLWECDGCHEWVCVECCTEQFDQEKDKRIAELEAQVKRKHEDGWAWMQAYYDKNPHAERADALLEACRAASSKCLSNYPST